MMWIPYSSLEFAVLPGRLVVFECVCFGPVEKIKIGRVDEVTTVQQLRLFLHASMTLPPVLIEFPLKGVQGLLQVVIVPIALGANEHRLRQQPFPSRMNVKNLHLGIEPFVLYQVFTRYLKIDMNNIGESSESIWKVRMGWIGLLAFDLL